MAERRTDRVKASQKALAAMPPKAAAKATAAARAENRTYPTSAQRQRALKQTGGR
jgi:hypothetical protein